VKRILTLSLLLAATGTLHAQSSKFQRHLKTSVELFRQHALAKASGSAVAQKTTTLQQRVTAEAGYNVSGTILTKSDTTLFRYSNGRGSKFDYNELFHNYYFPGNNDPGINPLDFGSINTQADTARYYRISATPILDEEMSAAYAGNGKVLDYRFRSVSSNYRERSVNRYDAQGRVDLMTGFEWNNTAQQWDSATRRVLTYNTQNEVLTDTIYQYNLGEWALLQVFQYAYNSSGKLVTASVKYDPTGAGVFIDYYDIGLEYYLNATLKTLQIDVNMSGTGLEAYERDSFAYDPTNTYRTFEQVWNYNSLAMQWEPSSRTIRNVSAMGIPDTTWSFSWSQVTNSFLPDGFVKTAYNSYKNPTVMQSFTNNGSGFDNDHRYFFYYQDFDPTAVKNVTAPEDMTVYPNPAANNISIRWKADAKQVQLNIMNGAGQLVHSESMSRMKEQEQVSLSGLAAGMYWLTVTSSDGALLYRTPLMKQ